MVLNIIEDNFGKI